jgi:hypothetical protein
MKANTILDRKWFLANMVVVVLAFMAITCVFIDGVEYADTVQAGETAAFIVKVSVDGQATVTNTRMVIGFLAPKSWNAAQNTTVTYTSSADAGVQTMSLVPAGTSPKNSPGMSWAAAIRNRFGVGENVLDDMEWVVYQSDNTYTVNNGDDLTADVLISAKAGMDNLKFKPTFFLNHTDDGLSTDDKHFKVYKGSCFTVTGGTGDLIDFCEVHFNAAQPLTATKDDFVTFSFQGDVADNDLIHADKIFLCAKAYTQNGGELEVCQTEAKSQMKKQFQYGNAYSITVWPANYFTVPEGDEVLKIEYSFRNEDGSVEITDAGNAFVYTFKCQ